jgi:hypothetical protein
MRPSSLRVASRWLRQAFVVGSISELLRYLQKPDWQKVLEIVQERDSEGDSGRFGDWIAEHYQDHPSDDPSVQAVLSDPDQIMSLYPEDFSQQTYEDYHRSESWEDPRWYTRDGKGPSWFNLRSPKLVKNQWLIHFTNNADSIACSGFRHGTDDLTRLGGSVSNAIKARKSSGKFNFGYHLGDTSQYRKGLKYGGEAVLFRASGLQAWHDGDQEWQVVFIGGTATDIIPLTQEFDKWVVNGLGRGGRPDQEGWDTLPQAVAWAMRNYAQYKRRLTCK